MSTSETTDIKAFMGRLKLLILLLIVIMVLPIAILSFQVDRRLDAFEHALKYRSPVNDREFHFGDESEHPVAHIQDGQIVYVPAYSHIYHGNGKPLLLTVTLSIRNTSDDTAIVVKSVQYCNTRGKTIRVYLEKPLRLPPLSTIEFLVERKDSAGGSGANFLVEWTSSQSVPDPIIETVMIDTEGQQGISFVRTGQPIRDNRKSITKE